MAETPKLGINARIARYFLDRPRLIVLGLLALITFGVGSLLILKTSGFPSPGINVALVQTVYPGASAATVEEQVSKPIENAVKTVDGVRSFASSSRDNFSLVSVEIKPEANADAVRTQIAAEVNSVKLPAGAEKPTTEAPKVATDEFYFAVVPKSGQFDPAEAYFIIQTLKREIEKQPSVEAVNFPGDFTKQIVVRVNTAQAAQAGLSVPAITSQLQSWGLSIPVTENATIDNKSQNIVLGVSGSSLDDLRNLRLQSPSNPGSGVRLADVATVSERFDQDNPSASLVGYRDGDRPVVSQSVTFSVDLADNANIPAFDAELQSIKNRFFDGSQASGLTPQQQQIFQRYELIETFSTAEQNKQQVDEVIAGMLGEKWHVGGVFGNIGYIFGGIQLVFLLMLALISWRAAIISALAIPLSFFFSTIYILATGNELNTLVLFSLVLVVGLVVDPALVVLEAIQRKVDQGLRGKRAALAGIQEIGPGLFMSVVTSIIVFVPFGVVSGVFGEIISYIPLTILPALVGSYVVPLVLLAWIAGITLRPTHAVHKREIDNIWASARWVMRVNQRIFDAKRWVRLLIIISSVVVPFAVAGAYIGSGAVKVVQFAQPQDSQFLVLTLTPLSQRTEVQTAENTRAMLETVTSDPAVKEIAALNELSFLPGEQTYFVTLKDPGERSGQDATTIAERINTKLEQPELTNRFFDIGIRVSGPGPSSQAFPISLGIKTDQLSDQPKVAQDLTKILQQVCEVEKNKFVVQADCPDNQRAIAKVDNGYEGKQQSFVEVQLNRQALASNPVNPLEVQQTLASLYNVNDGKKVTSFREQGTDLDLLVEQDSAQPTSVAALQAVPIRTLDGRTVRLGDIAVVREVPSQAAINRVKGEVVGVVYAKPRRGLEDQQSVTAIQNAAIKEFKNTYARQYPSGTVVETYTEGGSADIARSFSQLGLAFLLAIVLTYVVLVIFFNSLLLPIVILFSIPLTFLGVFPALAYLGGGQFGFLEIIGLIILVGLVENVGIFLMDLANRKVKEDGWDDKRAIIYASGIRFRPIILTKLTALFSLAPLAVLSQDYRSLAIVIMFGLLTSGFLSLFVSPILYIFFHSLSRTVRRKLRLEGLGK